MKKAVLSLALINSIIFAQEAAGAAAPQVDPKMTQIVMIVGMFAVLWFFMIRPEQKKQKAKEQMRSEIKKGDKVITIGGICGTITTVHDDRYVVQIDKNNAITVLKAAIDRKDMTEAEIAAEKENA